jgi:hypothetical protein
MNLEKVIFAFFIVLAATLNFGFFIGDIDRPELHHVGEFAAALIVNLIATSLKFGDRSHMGATQLSHQFGRCVAINCRCHLLGLSNASCRYDDTLCDGGYCFFVWWSNVG